MTTPEEQQKAAIAIMARQIAACQAWAFDEGLETALDELMVSLKFSPDPENEGWGHLVVTPTTVHMASCFLAASLYTRRDLAGELRGLVEDAIDAFCERFDHEQDDEQSVDEEDAEQSATHATTEDNPEK